MLFLVLGPIFLVAGIYMAINGGMLSIVAYTFIPIGVVFTALGVYFRRAGSNHAKLMMTGVPGSAVIREMSETSMRVNDNPVVKLTLDVTAPGVSPFTTSMRTPISMVTLSQVKLTPGTTLPVKVDPAKPTNFTIDWSAAAMGAAADPNSPIS